MDGSRKNLVPKLFAASLLKSAALAVASVASLTVMMPSSLMAASKLAVPQFKTDSGNALLTLSVDGPFEYTQEDINSNQQLILELKGVQLAPGASRAMDTSSYPGPVRMINALEGADPETVRVVLQLSEKTEAKVTRDGNELKVAVPISSANSSAATAQEKTPSASGDTGNVDAIPAAPETEKTAVAASPSTSQNPADASASSPSQAAPDSILQGAADVSGTKAIEQFKKSQDEKKFSGSRMTLQVRDAEVQDVLQLIARYSGFNIVVGDGVTGKVTFSLVDVPWDQVLDMVLRSRQLGGERSGNVLRVARLEDLRREKKEELEAKVVSTQATPKKVAIFPINYAELSKMKELIAPFLSNPAQSGDSDRNKATVSTGDASFVMTDEKTKSLIIRDIPEVLSRVKAVIQELDVPVPQILIEGKVVEVSENFKKGLSGNISTFGNGGTPFGFAAAGANIESLLGDSGSEAFASGGSAFSNLGVEPNLSIIPGFSRLKALLQIEESEGQGRTIVSPRIVVQNATAATLTDSTPFLNTAVLPSTTEGSTTSSQVSSASTSLKVTPTVANDGNILLQVDLTKSDVVPVSDTNSGASTKTLSTSVYVESGNTLAIGGLYSNGESHQESGFPWLRKIPVLGWFFGGTSDSTTRKELFIFITPRILNPQKLPSELNTEGSGVESPNPAAPAPSGRVELKESRILADLAKAGVK